MVTKLSTHLNTSLGNVVQGVDSEDVITLIGTTKVAVDSGTIGNFIATISPTSPNPGIVITGSGSNSAAAFLRLDSAVAVTKTGTQTLTNKTINLTANTLTGTAAQFNAAMSNGSFATIGGTETLTDKTLTSPVINSATINNGTANNLATLSLRDATTNTKKLIVTSNAASPVLSADRTLTLDVNNADRTLSLMGNVTLGGALTTSGAHATTFTTGGTTALTLPTSGTVVTKDSAGGTISANYFIGNGAQLTGVASGDIVADTTPQLGGDLDANGNNILLDNATKISFGSDTLQVKTDGSSNSIIQGSSTTYLRGSSVNIGSNGGSGGYPNTILVTGNTSTSHVEMLYGTSKKFETTSTGVTVTGNITVSGTVDGVDVLTIGNKVNGIEASADVTDATNVGTSLTAFSTSTDDAPGDLIPVYDVSASAWKKMTIANAALGGAQGNKGQKGEVGGDGGAGSKGQKGEVGGDGGAGSKGQKGEVGGTGGAGGAGSKGQKGEVGTFGGGNITITNQAILSNASSNWTGDPGTQGKIQYHSNRWYIVSDQSSDRIVQFRRNGTDVSYVDNSGVYQGTATSANWSDLAEKYKADAVYEAGDLVGIGGAEEITKYTKDMPFAGVISEKPGVRMNCNEENMDDPLWPYVCLKGRVPVKINGTAIKGDYIITDDNGKAKSSKVKPDDLSLLIGIALEDGTDEVEVKI